MPQCQRPGRNKIRSGLRLVGLTGLERSEEHTSELQSQSNLVCRLLLEKKKAEAGHVSHPTRSPAPTRSINAADLHTTMCSPRPADTHHPIRTQLVDEGRPTGYDQPSIH